MMRFFIIFANMKENYIVSARKYRPATFATVVGQNALTHTLKTAIASGKLAHAYLFCGPRGVGKTTCARIFAKAINCEHLSADGEPCNECESCRAFNEQRSYNIVELDAASNNSVDDIRGITDQVRIPPQVGRYRVFIIDEVHMLSTQAFNAFLKTLEEPPEYAIFILATTEKQKIIPTILSRCQIYDFARITVPDIVAQLQYIAKDRGVQAENAALNVIAQKADGALRDALSIFDQVSASSEGNITYQSTIENLNVLDHDYYFRLDEAFLAGDVPSTLLVFKEIRDHGFDAQFFINGLAQHLRDLMMASSPRTAPLLEMNDDVAQRYVLEAAKFTPQFYYKAMDLCNTCDLNYRDASNKQFLVELTLIKIVQLIAAPAPTTPTGQGMKKIQPAAAQPAAKQVKSAPQPQQAKPDQQPQQAAPQPQAKPAPAADPVPEPQPPFPEPPHPATIYQAQPAPAKRTNIGSTRVMVGNVLSGKSASTTAAAEPTPAQESYEAQHQAFTDKQLLEVWQDYIVKHPHEHLIINTMRTSKPRRITDTQLEISVQNAGQVSFMNNALPHILDFVRKGLSNDDIGLTVVLDESMPAPKIMTERELIEDIKTRHPEFNDMLDDFKLTLA
ncbi:MAG: DNA polymerase III subunit gamma/tau [Muribaculaceae bacterium]|nr:DNA polymerase III subunit gamma/tau [Muribaculaceae bacterium]